MQNANPLKKTKQTASTSLLASFTKSMAKSPREDKTYPDWARY